VKARPPRPVRDRSITVPLRGLLYRADYWPLNTALIRLHFRGRTAFAAYFLKTLFAARRVKGSGSGVNRNDLHEPSKCVCTSISPHYQLRILRSCRLRRLMVKQRAPHGIARESDQHCSTVSGSFRADFLATNTRFSRVASRANSRAGGESFSSLTSLRDRQWRHASCGETASKDEGITLIRSLNVYDTVSRTTVLRLGRRTGAGLASVTVESGDILLNITGASVARCCIVPDRHLFRRA